MNQRACRSVGIDLGTTFSTLAYVDAQGLPRVVADSSGQAVMPSIVFFDDHEILVGQLALEQAALRADRVVQFIKVHMGDPWRREFLGRIHTPESVSAILLGQLVKEAEPQIGPVPSAVITVPAYFTEKRRRATQQAGEIAGLEVIGTLNEPMAATLAYGLHHTDQPQKIVVYDLGGGTFDVTVVEIAPNELQELATAGNRQLGGRDWDQALIEFVADSFKKAHGVDLHAIPRAMQDLLLESERAKRRLSRMQRTSIRVQAEGRDHQVEITRAQFEGMTVGLLQATRLTTETALADAKLRWDQISRVVLIGGSTQMPAVRTMLQQLGGKPPDTGVNPVLAVALGAAVYAHLLETGTGLKAVVQKPSEEAEPSVGYELGLAPPSAASGPPAAPQAALAPPVVHFVTAHGVGLKVRSGQEIVNKVLIPKNRRVPAYETRRFYTRATGSGGRELKLEITQGDAEDLKLTESLGTGWLPDLPANAPDGQPVDVTMEFDDQGRLHIRALYVPARQEMAMILEIPGGLQPAEVEEHRRYLEDTGFLPRRDQPTPADPQGPAAVSNDSFRFSLDDLLEDLRSDPDEDDDLPMIEPVD